MRVGNGVGKAVPLGLTDCEGKIFTDGSVKPNCKALPSAFPPLSDSAVIADASIVRSISNGSY